MSMSVEAVEKNISADVTSCIEKNLPSSVQELRESALTELQSKGMKYNAVAPAELERMRKAAQPVVDKVSGSLNPETVKLFNEELDRIRK